MLAGELKQLLRPIQLGCEKKSVVQDFRFLQVNPKDLVLIGAMTSIRIAVDLGFTQSFSVDAAAFCGVLQFLAPSNEVEFSLDNGTLLWSSGKAKGKLATTEPKNLEAPEFNLKPKAWPSAPLPTDPRIVALIQRGSISGNNNMLAGGAFAGIVLYPQKTRLTCVSSDNTTIVVTSEKIECEFEHPVYLSQSVVPLLNDLAARTGDFHFNEKAVAFKGENITVLMNQIAPNQYDLLTTAKKFMSGETSVDLDKHSITLFTKRVSELSDRFGKAMVTLTMKNGGIQLHFSEGLVENEEFFLAEELNPDAEMSAKLGADSITKALTQADRIILDYITRQVIVFSNTSRESPFTFIIAGKHA